MTNYKYRLRNITKERRSHLRHEKSLKSRFIGEHFTGVKVANVTILFHLVRRPLPLPTPIPHAFTARRINEVQGKVMLGKVHHFQETLEFSGKACWQRPHNAKQRKQQDHPAWRFKEKPLDRPKDTVIISCMYVNKLN